MGAARKILLFSIPGLMFCIVPIHGISLRLCWQLAAIWLAGVCVILFLSSGWRRVFYALALAQVVMMSNVVLVSYITLLMITIGMLTIEGYRRMNARRVMDMVGLASLLLTGWVVLQAAGVLPGFVPGQPGGPFNIDAASAFIGMCLPVFLRRQRIFRTLCGLFWLHLLPLSFLGIAMTGATTGAIAALVALAAFALLGRIPRRTLLVSTLVVVTLMAIFFIRVDPLAGTLDNPRWRVWQRVCWTFESSPLGRGLGSFAQIFPVILASEKDLQPTVSVKSVETDGIGVAVEYAWLHAHNEYLQVGFEMGGLAMALLFAWLLHKYYRAWTRRKTMPVERRIILAGLAATATAAFGFHIFHIAPTALIGCAWIGLSEIGDKLPAPGAPDRPQGGFFEKCDRWVERQVDGLTRAIWAALAATTLYIRIKGKRS